MCQKMEYKKKIILEQWKIGFKTLQHLLVQNNIGHNFCAKQKMDIKQFGFKGIFSQKWSLGYIPEPQQIVIILSSYWIFLSDRHKKLKQYFLK